MSVQLFNDMRMKTLIISQEVSRGWWKYALSEAKAIRNGVGIIDVTAYKAYCKGPKSNRVLDWFTVTNC